MRREGNATGAADAGAAALADSTAAGTAGTAGAVGAAGGGEVLHFGKVGKGLDRVMEAVTASHKGSN